MATARKTAAKRAATRKTTTQRSTSTRSSGASRSRSAGQATRGNAARKSPARRSRADATAVLEKQHREVQALFRRYERLAKAEAEADERQALAEQICQKLTLHATLEEEIFYPAAREAGVDSDLLDEATVEHASAKDLIGQLEAASPEDELYDAKVQVLGEYVNHHVQEEEGEMFKKARRAKMDLEGLGERLQARTAELQSGAEAQSGE